MEKDPPSESSGSSDFKHVLGKILEFIGLNHAPDTTEDLEQEVLELLEEGEEQGLISSHEWQMINSIFEFRDTLVHEVMTPRSEMIFAEITSSITELVKLITEQGFTRIPIHAEGNPDQVLGTLHAKDLLGCVDHSNGSPNLKDLVKPALFVSEFKRIIDLLLEFQSQKIHMAIVTDEFGSVRGLITLEDVLEEIVGEIDDEYDKSEKPWKKLNDDTMLIYAKVDMEEVESFYQLKLPEGPYESVGGLIIHQLGHVPKNGESVTVDSLTFQVVSATKRRIRIVKVKRTT